MTFGMWRTISWPILKEVTLVQGQKLCHELAMLQRPSKSHQITIMSPEGSDI